MTNYICGKFKLRQAGSGHHGPASVLYPLPEYWASSTLSLSLKGQHLQPSSALSLLLPNGPGSVEIQKRAQTISFSCTKGRVPVCSLIPQGHYRSLLLDYDSEIPALVIISFILSVSLLCILSASVFLFCFPLLLDPIFLFISTFSCKRFSSASAFIYRKSHYVTSGNFNICLKRTAFWKYR